MRTVSVDGVVFTKAKQVAEDFGYTTDYIGQLCRSEKIHCQLVGRSWYVSTDSLKVHKHGKYTSNTPILKSSNHSTDNPEISVTTVASVRPVLTKSAIRNLFHSSQALSHKSVTKPQYSSDEVDLLPQPVRTRVVMTRPKMDDDERVTVPVNIIGDEVPQREFLPIEEEIVDLEMEPKSVEEVQTTKMSIKNESRKRHLAFTRVPQVPLRGKLKVTNAHTKSPTINSEKVTKISPPPVLYKQSVYAPSSNVANNTMSMSAKAESLVDNKTVTFSPSLVKKKSDESIFQAQSTNLNPLFYRYLVVAVLLFSLLFIFTSLFSVLRIEVDGSSNQSKLFLKFDFSF